MALTDSLTRPLAEERAGNAGRTPCCRASWDQELRHDVQQLRHNDQELRHEIKSFVMMIMILVLEMSSLIALRAWALDGENSQMGRTMLVDEKRVHPEVEQLPVVHISWPVQQFSIYAWGFSSCLPAHDVHDVQLDFLSEINLDVANYQQRVLIAKQIINSVYIEVKSKG